MPRILTQPLAPAAGMCLLNSANGVLMLSLYTYPSFSKDPITILYYSIVLTVITIILTIVIGIIQLLFLILKTAEPTGKFWDGVAIASEHWDVIGMFNAISVNGSRFFFRLQEKMTD